jgi:hypothetical protein
LHVPTSEIIIHLAAEAYAFANIIGSTEYAGGGVGKHGSVANKCPETARKKSTDQTKGK